MIEQLQMLKVRDVVRLTSLSRPTIYRMIKRDEFPRQIKLSKYRVAWRAAEIEAWLNSQRH